MIHLKCYNLHHRVFYKEIKIKIFFQRITKKIIPHYLLTYVTKYFALLTFEMEATIFKFPLNRIGFDAKFGSKLSFLEDIVRVTSM